VPPLAERSAPISLETARRRWTTSMISASHASIAVRSSAIRSTSVPVTAAGAGEVGVLMGMSFGRGRRTPETKNAPGLFGPGASVAAVAQPAVTDTGSR
jgi:hypothetical protein